MTDKGRVGAREIRRDAMVFAFSEAMRPAETASPGQRDQTNGAMS